MQRHHHPDDDFLLRKNAGQPEPATRLRQSPEAIRDILRGALAQEATQNTVHRVSRHFHVYEHEKRDLASRIVSTQHHHHDLSVATLHVHINHDDLPGDRRSEGRYGDVQHFADDIAQRGVRHGHTR